MGNFSKFALILLTFYSKKEIPSTSELLVTHLNQEKSFWKSACIS
jgi:hypothetical protein